MTISIASSRQEVILCAGSIDTPKILLLSGIGQATDLAAFNIEIKHDLPGIGKNLQDHCGLPIIDHLGHGVSQRLAFMISPEKVKEAENQWLHDHSGPIATLTHDSALAFLKDFEIAKSDELKSLDAEVQNFISLPNVPHYEIVMVCSFLFQVSLILIPDLESCT